MEPNVDQHQRPAPERKKKTCTCYLKLQDGKRMIIGDVSSFADEDHKAFAKKAHRMASGSLKRLKLRGYSIVVVDGAQESVYSLDEFNK